MSSLSLSNRGTGVRAPFLPDAENMPPTIPPPPPLWFEEGREGKGPERPLAAAPYSRVDAAE